MSAALCDRSDTSPNWACRETWRRATDRDWRHRLGDPPGSTGVHLGQQGASPKGVVHHLSLQSHDDQSTSAIWATTRNRLVAPQNMCLVCTVGGRTLTIIAVATSQTASTRAKDTDRNDTCQIFLDTALSEGQLSMTEHQQRVKAATNATTLGDLRALVSDLQTANAPPVQLPALKKPRLSTDGAGGSWGIRLAIMGVLVVLGIGIGWGPVRQHPPLAAELHLRPGRQVRRGGGSGRADPAASAALTRRAHRVVRADEEEVRRHERQPAGDLPPTTRR